MDAANQINFDVIKMPSLQLQLHVPCMYRIAVFSFPFI